MNTALIHSQTPARPTARTAAAATTAGVLRHPFWRELARSGAPALAGGIALLAAWALAAVLAIPAGQLPALFLVAGAMIWLALALESGRRLVTGAALANLAVMVAGAWLWNTGALAIAPLYGLHLLLLGVALLDRDAGRSPLARTWSGVELTALALLVVHL